MEKLTERKVLREVNNISQIEPHKNVCRYFNAWIENKGLFNKKQFIKKHLLNNLVNNKYNILEPSLTHLFDNNIKTIAKINKIKNIFKTYYNNSEKLPPNIGINYSIFLQMEYCGEWTLKDFICDLRRRPKYTEVKIILKQICSGLNHIHKSGIIHRDLKPANIFIDINYKNFISNSTFFEIFMLHDANNTKNFRTKSILLLSSQKWQIKIGDFGLSKRKVLKKFETNYYPIFDDFDITHGLGTYFYTAPEQFKDENGNYSIKVDIYSLGIILFELLYPPCNTNIDRIDALLLFKEKDIMPKKIKCNFPKMCSLIKKMLNKKPSKRPNAKQIFKLLENDINEINMNNSLKKKKF